MKVVTKITIGKDVNGDFLDHSLTIEPKDAFVQRVTRVHYEKVEEAIIQNMPEVLFNNLCDQIEAEETRRYGKKCCHTCRIYFEQTECVVKQICLNMDPSEFYCNEHKGEDNEN